MKSVLKRCMTCIASGGLALAVQAGSAGEAHASSSCSGAGYLCFYDYATSNYGNLAGTNANWAVFGWNNRADWFYNQGNYQQVCIYAGTTYAGSSYNLWRGETYEWANTVSSNRWTNYYNGC